jgi:hypothetical protein
MRSVVLILALAFCGQTSASFITFNDSASGTYGFTDQNTGSKWLSLELSLGQSYNDTVAKFQSFGYKLATASQVYSLMDSVFPQSQLAGKFVDSNQRIACGTSTQCFQSGLLWQSLFLPNIVLEADTINGASNETKRSAIGYFKGNQSTSESLWNLAGTYVRPGVLNYVYNETFTRTYTQSLSTPSTYGFYFVNAPAPAPAPLLLTSTGFAVPVSEMSSFSLLLLSFLGLIVIRVRG